MRWVERGLMERRIRRLRNKLALGRRHSRWLWHPVANIRQYEIGRHMPPPAVRAYLKVIEPAEAVAA